MGTFRNIHFYLRFSEAMNAFLKFCQENGFYLTLSAEKSSFYPTKSKRNYRTRTKYHFHCPSDRTENMNLVCLPSGFQS